MKVIDVLKITSLILIGFIWSQNALAKNQWNWCYSDAEKRVYFYNSKNPLIGQGCKSETFFDASKENMESAGLVEDSLDANGFPGQRMEQTLKRSVGPGKKAIVTRWNDLSHINTIAVLEPNFKSKTVNLRCLLPTSSKDYRAFYREGALYIQLKLPGDERKSNIECKR